MSAKAVAKPTKPPVEYEISMLAWKTVTQVFFREIRPRGAFNIPREGPVIFVGAPHHNQFLDPLLLALQVYNETRRPVSFLTAAKSMKRKAVGFFTKLMGSIPVSRAADDAKPATGRITLSDDDPCLVIGHDTRFTSELKPKMQIMLPRSLSSCVAEVLEVLSDSELRIKREFGGDSGKITARVRDKQQELAQAGEVGIEFKVMPFVDQREMYAHVYTCLKNGGAIGIFPEGGSHDRTDLLPLKAGVSVMALGAMANDPSCQVKIVPVGLSYFHPHRFRSRAVVEFGSAIDVPAEHVEMFKRGGTEKRDAVAKFLDLIYDGLKTVTVRAPDYDTLMLVQAARRLYKTPGQHLTLGQVVELNRRMLEGYQHFKDEPKIANLRKDVLNYNRLVRDLGLRDHQVPRAKKAGWKTLGLLLYRVVLLLVWSVLALPGTILNGPLFVLASILSRKRAKEALAASTVKLAGRDVLATWKILISLGGAPILYSIYAIISFIVASKANLPLKQRILTPYMVLVALPIMNYAALKFGEAGMDVLKSLRPLIIALVPGQQRSLDRLKAMRIHLSNEVAAVINEFGPKLYSDFDQWRILVPSSDAPPSSGTPGLWRRKSATGGVDAQGLGLIHPFTWIDERVFGWSRSAHRGTNAWAGVDESHAGTPDFSEEEDGGDYEDVVSLIPSHDDTSSISKPRSRNSSYADLQKLRMTSGKGNPSLTVPAWSSTSTASSPISPTSELDGIHFRQNHNHHARKHSLCDGIAVERIAAVEKREPFEEATVELNCEADTLKHRKQA